MAHNILGMTEEEWAFLKGLLDEHVASCPEHANMVSSILRKEIREEDCDGIDLCWLYDDETKLVEGLLGGVGDMVNGIREKMVT